MVWGIGLRRLGSGCGRRLGTGSCVIRETTQTGCPWSRPRVSLSIYLSIAKLSSQRGGTIATTFTHETLYEPFLQRLIHTVYLRPNIRYLQTVVGTIYGEHKRSMDYHNHRQSDRPLSIITPPLKDQQQQHRGGRQAAPPHSTSIRGWSGW